jgi:hypothetical protein
MASLLVEEHLVPVRVESFVVLLMFLLDVVVVAG